MDGDDEEENIRLEYAKALSKAIDAFNNYMTGKGWDIWTKLEFKAIQLAEDEKTIMEVFMREG